jgi:hypothetical protein
LGESPGQELILGAGLFLGAVELGENLVQNVALEGVKMFLIIVLFELLENPVEDLRELEELINRLTPASMNLST